jgi:GntR family transcriptional repressor for pyruvate dehydrogenase complex
LRSQVYSQLKEKLLEGFWKVGEKLPSEHELCETLGVSRVTVRAAIQQLEILGLVETRHGGGTYVREFSGVQALDNLHPLLRINKHKDIIAILEYRQIMEKGTVKLALRRMTAQDIKALEETYRKMVQFVDDPVRHAEADHSFHSLLANISQNPLLIKVSSKIYGILSTSMVDIVRLLGNDIGLRYHRELIDAIKRKDTEACERLMEEHIEKTIQAVIAHAATDGD